MPFETGLLPIVIEYDAQNVVNMVNSGINVSSDIGLDGVVFSVCGEETSKLIVSVIVDSWSFIKFPFFKKIK